MPLDWNKPIETVSGLPARIICKDRKYMLESVAYPYVILIKESADQEGMFSYDKNGKPLTGVEQLTKQLTLKNKVEKEWRWVFRKYLGDPYISWVYYTEEEVKKEANRFDLTIVGRVLETEQVRS